VEQAITAKHYGFEPDERQQISVGFGNYDRMVEVLAAHCAAGDFVCGARFTMADVYVGSQVLWGLMFKTCPICPPLPPMPRGWWNAPPTAPPRRSTMR
jgi:glutathione S-transferase